MTSIRALLVGTTVALLATACTDNSGTDFHPPDQSAITRSTDAATVLLDKSPVRQGFRPRPVASGHDRSDDSGHEVSETVKGRALFQIVCAGTGEVTVTIPSQSLSKLVTCGAPAVGFPFRGELAALVVGQRNSTGVYAWRILTRA